jgi:putative oxidoreductase
VILTSLTKYRESALLFLRVALGLVYIRVHGWPNLAAGPHGWRAMGAAMGYVGIHFQYLFWGLMAALSETLGCVLFILGFLFRPACILLFITLSVAAISLLKRHEGWGAASHPVELAILFLSLIFIGPGKYSVDKS